MIKTGFETRVKVQQIIESQLPEFVLDESPKAVDFLKQYYISQEYQSGSSDITENLDQYLKLDNLTPEVVVDSASLSADITSSDTTIEVSNTKGFPQKYGLLKIDNEIITYTDTTATSFTGCVRGFSGITTYHSDENPGEVVFESTSASSHSSGVTIQNLSSLFLREFYKKLKFSLTPGLEDVDFISDLNVGNFIKESKSFYKSKGTDESFKILFNVLYGVKPTVINLEDFLIKPSFSEYVRREVVVAEAISGNPSNLIGQTIRQSDNSNIFASISNVDPISRHGLTYYQLSMFIGYDDDTINSSSFSLPGRTLVVEKSIIGSNVITVDSTVGFDDSGDLIVNGNTISYTSKSVNQFFGCSGIVEEINPKDSVRSNLFVYGYENGDLTKKVELRLTGVLSSFITLSDKFYVEEGDSVYVRNLGELIKNPLEDKTFKQKFANSWIYNTSSRYQIDSIEGSSFVLGSLIDKSSLKVGDSVDILIRDSETVVPIDSVPFVQTVNTQINQIVLGNLTGFVYNPSLKYDIRRKLKKASSSVVPFEFESITSDIQNVYNESDEFMYITSNSLPSYTLTKNLFEASIPEATVPALQSYDPLIEAYSILSFPSNVPFITGDEVHYSAENDPIPGLEDGGVYYVEVLSDLNQIKLYISRSFIGSINNITLKTLPPNSGSHRFVLNSQKSGIISPQKILRKFPLQTNIADGKSDETVPGKVGVLINGVEIDSYKSDDRIYYGPIEDTTVLNPGSGYDVINPPLLEFVDGVGAGAKIQPVVAGSIERVVIDPQDIGLESIVSIALTGGNGTGAAFSPVLNRQKFRDIEFSAKLSTDNGGVDIAFDTITFFEPHLLNNGDLITYNKNGNDPLGKGTFDGSNAHSGETLVDAASYYAEIVNSTTIRLYENTKDLAVGVNTVGFTEFGNSGIHKFKTADPKVILQDIVVLDPGSKYENRKLIVKQSGISTYYDKISFNNHGFNNGDLIKYEYETNSIVGLSSNTNYRVLKIDDNSFRLCEDIIESGRTLSNFERQKYINFESQGSGYQYFKYPDIKFSINYSSVGVGTTAKTVGVITATPIIRGEIIDTYLYESGSDYGSKTLNFHRKPNIVIKSGRDAEIKPIVTNGSITKAIVQYGGKEYYSTPSLTVIGEGSGAELRPVIENGKIIDVVITKSGIGYTAPTTSINVESAGINALVDSNVRYLSVDKKVKYGEEILDTGEKGLQYSITGYNTKLQNEFKDTDSSKHSPIIGWSYDGNPIYGPYGYSDAEDINSPSRVLTTGYILDSESVVNRPTGFTPGFFIEDYRYAESGDLDEHNGRFCKTPEFPNGAYVYFAALDNENIGISSFPYFVGDSYRSPFIKENRSLSQSFDFNNSILVRNTLPYKLNDNNAGNDFVYESYEFAKHEAKIDSVLSSSIVDTDIIGVGTDYKIKDEIVFDNTGTGGNGFRSIVSKLTGKNVVDLSTNIDSYYDAVIIRDTPDSLKVKISPSHDLNNRDYVALSGFTTSLTKLKKLNQIGIVTNSTFVSKDIPTNSVIGLATDVYVNEIPDNVSIGSTVKIGSELTSLLNVFPEQKIIRVIRNVGSAHTTTTPIYFEPDTFTISASVDSFDSKFNDKVFFKPSEAIGFGASVGVNSTTSFNLGVTTDRVASYTRAIETQSIFIKDHPFSNNQEVILTVPNSHSKIEVSSSTFGSTFNIPSSGSSQTVFISNKTKNTIGIKTTRTSSEVFFISDGGSADSYEYSLESNFPQVKTKVQKIKTTVSVSTDHGLKNRDQITLEVNPNKTVGVQTFSSVYVKFDEDSQKLLINPIGFTSESVDITNDLITLTSHKLKTGDKVYYKSEDLISSGLTTGAYFVYKFDDNRIRLCESYNDSVSNPPIHVSVGSTGGILHELSLINPELISVRNNSLKFDLSDSSLNGYDFNFYFDEEFADQFLSVESSSNFVVSGVGTIGVSTNASLTLNYLDDIPQKLFYAAKTPSGYISTSDRDVNNSSQINFENSLYNGTYEITGVGATTFDISLTREPEVLSYTSSECDILKYETTSTNTTGGIAGVKILSTGNKYKKLPAFKEIISKNGTGGFLIAKSNTIGKINQITISNQGYEYPSDKTLSPVAFIPPLIKLKSSLKVNSVGVSSGGSGYSYPPDVILVDSVTREIYDSGLLEVSLDNRTIGSIKIVETPYGLSENETEVLTINNDNGYSINKIEASSGFATCYLSTPVLGFTTPPFDIGDQIFVEGLVNSDSGTGYNSSDYGYRFFTVSGFTNTIPATVEFSVSGLSTNPGVAKTTQDGIPSIINYKNYPLFSLEKSFSKFRNGETLLVYIGDEYIETDLEIIESSDENVKVFGDYVLKVNDKIKGSKSGTIATINTIEENFGKFNIGVKLRKDLGWKNDVGKLNDDKQFIPDNDYYQNLSYSVKSPIEYDEMSVPVNRLLHPSGMKNFADTEIQQNVSAGIRTTEDNSFEILDFINEDRVDQVQHFDQVLDIDSIGNKTKFVKLENKKLTSFIECVSNRVLQIDNIRSRFSNVGLEESDQNIIDNDDENFGGFARYLIQIVDTDRTEYQLNDVVVIGDLENNFILEKLSLTNQELPIASIDGGVDLFKNNYIAFNAVDPYTKDYDIKILSNKFATDLVGVGTISFGLTNLTSVIKNVPAGITSSIVSFSADEYSSLYFNIYSKNTITSESNYSEIYVNHDGVDVYISEYYYNTDESITASLTQLGEFDASLSNGILSLNFTNTEQNNVRLGVKSIGFGTEGLGIGTYRFKNEEQTDETERTAIYETNYSNSSGITTVVSASRSLFTTIKSTLNVSVGSTSALYQTAVLNESDGDTHLAVYQPLSVGSTSGIGTFGSGISGSNVELVFYPDSTITDNVEISSFSELVYTDFDLQNRPDDLEYGPIKESHSFIEYGGINGTRVERKDFDLFHEKTPIFEKTFNPSKTRILDPVTGIFTITNHFFNTGEELIYTPESTLSDISAVGIATAGGTLPSEVYVIKLTEDTFKLAKSKSLAESGIGVTFTSIGAGNAHKLEMTKKLEKSLITIDNLVQYPITYCLVSHTLLNNYGGSVGVGTTYISLSGITSIRSGDLLKIEDEFVKVVNVGYGETSLGPITGIGTTNLVFVERGAVGTAETSHADLLTVDLYRGSYNLKGNKIHFTDAPAGDFRSSRDASNLNYFKSDFTGRVFLRKDYTTNQLYDNISESFTGIGQTYTLTTSGLNTVGLGTQGGNGVLFINNMFQAPSSDNNPINNFNIIEDTNIGISSIIFSGSSADPSQEDIISAYDVNENQLPRGGVIVSLGSTGGLGIAPLVGASVTAVIDGSGSITAVGVGTTDVVGSGYYGTVSVGVTDSNHTGTEASITATVGVGGSLSFTIGDGGSGYTNPIIQLPSPSYSNLPVQGVSRLGIGATTDVGTGLLLNLEVGASSTTGIGSTLHEVKSFKIVRNGYGFNLGDVITPVGLVTEKGIPNPLSEFELTVTDTFTDTFASWQFGELDYIDSIKSFQDGNRKRFPLFYDGSLLSFETPDSDVTIDLNSLLIIYVNGVLQEPNESYIFNGGSSFSFVTPPDPSDVISIFFYRGTKGEDSSLVEINESIKVGDTIRIEQNDAIPETIGQNPRDVTNLPTSDKIETANYNQNGIDQENARPLTWIKQKVDKIINNELVYKVRDSIESQIVPVSKIIYDVNVSDTQVFVDNSPLFNYEENESSIIISEVDGIIVDNIADPVSAAITATVSSNGTIGSLTINDGGSGYSGSSVDLKLSSPRNIGIGTTATATASITAGIITSVTITNPGLGYSVLTPPQVIVPLPNVSYENVTSITGVEGFSGIITGISTTVGKISNTTFTITVANDGGGNKYYINGVKQDTLSLLRGNTYIFDQNDSSNGTHEIRISTTSDGTHNGGTQYTDGWTYTGSAGTDGEGTFVVPLDAPDTLYYYCVNHSGMGGTANIDELRALQFDLSVKSPITFTGTNLSAGYVISIFNTVVGSGVTSIDTSESATIGIGTEFLDNVYKISTYTGIGATQASIVCNIVDSPSVAGIDTFGYEQLGKFSWGRLFGFSRSSSPISIGVTGKTVNSGLSTFPTIQRRGYGLRDTGALKKDLL